MSIFYFLTFLIEILGTVGGFGSSVFFVPLAQHYFPFHEVLAMVSLLHLFSNLSKIALFRKGIDWSLLLKMGLPSVIFVLLGAWGSQFINAQQAPLYLGLFLSVFALLLIIWPKFKVKINSINTISSGALSGLMAGFLGTGGAVRGLALASFHMSKDGFLATSALIDFIVDASRFGMYFEQGYFSQNVLKHTLMLLAISILGSYLGKVLLKKFDQETFRKTSLIFILITGLYSLYQYWFLF